MTDSSASNLEMDGASSRQAQLHTLSNYITEILDLLETKSYEQVWHVFHYTLVSKCALRLIKFA